MAIRTVAIVALVAVGFYFGRWLGAIALPMMAYVLLPYRYTRGAVAPFTTIAKRLKSYLSGGLTRLGRAPPSQKPQAVRSCAPQWAYDCLAVTPDDDIDAVKKARNRLINRYHPDKQGASAEKSHSEARIHEINRAYHVILQVLQSQQTVQGQQVHHSESNNKNKNAPDIADKE